MRTTVSFVRGFVSTLSANSPGHCISLCFTDGRIGPKRYSELDEYYVHRTGEHTFPGQSTCSSSQVGSVVNGFAKGDRGTSPQCAFVSILLAWRALHCEQPAAGRSIDALRARRRAWLDTVPARETDQSPDPTDAAAGSTGQPRKARAALGHLDRALVAQERALGMIAARVRRG